MHPFLLLLRNSCRALTRNAFPRKPLVSDRPLSGTGSFTATVCCFSVYVQFYFEDVQVLQAAEGQIQKGLRSRDSSSLRKNDGGSLTSDLETPEAKMLKLEDPKPDTHSAEDCQKGQSSATRTSCVSCLFLVTQKEGLMLRNYQLPREGDGHGEGQELQRSFQATVLWLGRPQLWSHSRETGNPLELEETSCNGEEGVTRHEVRQETALRGGLIRLGAGSSGSLCDNKGSRLLINESDFLSCLSLMMLTLLLKQDILCWACSLIAVFFILPFS